MDRGYRHEADGCSRYDVGQGVSGCSQWVLLAAVSACGA